MVGFVERVRAVGVFVKAERQWSLPFPSMRPLRILVTVGTVTREPNCPATLLWGSLNHSKKRRKRLIRVIQICGNTGIDDFRVESYDSIPELI